MRWDAIGAHIVRVISSVTYEVCVEVAAKQNRRERVLIEQQIAAANVSALNDDFGPSSECVHVCDGLIFDAV